MGLEYKTQPLYPILGSKSSALALTPVTLGTRYDLDGTSTKAFAIGGYSKLELSGQYTAGTGETSNSIQIQVETSPDGTNWYRLLNEAVSTGTSTLTLREFTIVQTTGYGTLAYDAQSANFTAGLVVTGAGAATAIIESDTDSGTTGTLLLSNVVGTFVNDEALTDSGTGAAVVNGILTSITNFTLPLDISAKYARVSVKETGVASNAGTIYLEGTLSGQ